MNNVMHVIDSLAIGGAERMLVELVTELHRQKVTVGVCVTRGNIELSSELPQDVDLLVLNRKHTWDWFAVQSFLRYCRGHGVRILHAHGRSSMRFCALVKALSGGRLLLIFHDHFGNIEVDDHASMLFSLFSRIFVDFYIAVDPVLQDWAINKLGIKQKNTRVLENALNFNRFTTAKHHVPTIMLGSHPLCAAMVANLKPQKDHPLLFKSLAHTKYAKNKLDILIIGTDLQDHYSKYCHQLVKELGLDNNIYFLGSRNDILHILKQVDFGLLSSISESGPLTLLEYMACGLPFLVTTTGQIARKIKEETPYFFVHPGDVIAYAEALDNLVNLISSEREQMGKKNRTLVSQLFSIESTTKNLICIYSNLLNGKIC